MPILNTQCAGCHGNNGNFTVTTTSATYTNIASLKGSIDAGAQYMLDMGSYTLNHGGGQVISPSSGDYTTIQSWISSGAVNN
ncbi:hypothetical protein C9926_01795 [Sulfurovum lithotrophicum]|nr:hypothetical protein C9926_01795 [Sulfurovum lithotrophicum]